MYLNALDSNGNLVLPLSQTFKQVLRRVRDEHLGFSSTEASNLLCFFEGECQQSRNSYQSNSNVSQVLPPVGNNWAEGTTSHAMIYPNPNKGNFVVKSEEDIMDIKVFDMTGRAIKFDLKGNGKTLELTLPNVQPGIYRVNYLLDSGLSHSQTVVI